MSDFVHLHTHSDFSLLKSAATIPGLVARARELGMSHLALTDDANMFGALQFFNECRSSENGPPITPILGCDMNLTDGKRTDRDSKNSSRIVLLAKDAVGYRNLLQLSSLAYTEGFYYRPRIDDELIETFGDGLIALTGSISGDIPSLILQNRFDDAEARARRYKDRFGDDFYFELQDHGLPEERVVNENLVTLSRALSIPLVAANECYYTNKDDWNAQDILLCIGSGRKKNEPGRFRFSTQEFYLKSADEMRRIFSEFPDAVARSREIAEKCELTIDLPGPIFPEYEIPHEYPDTATYLRELTFRGLAERYGTVDETLRARAEYELGVIIPMNFAAYFLIVWDFIKFARDRGIPVGPGRGSGAGSIVAYALKITDIDPLTYNLLFERFLNPDRVSLPDFDIDFCYERRGEVIEYVTQKYGRDRVGQIITFGTLKAKAVIRDVARVLDLPYAEADMTAKLVPNDLKITLPKALEQEPRLREIRDRGGVHGELIDVSLKLEGLHRHPSTHAAGIVIGREPLTHYVPLYRDPKTGAVSTQYTMEMLEDCGLVKMDFLGLKTLTLITNTVALIRRRGIEIDIDAISETDVPTYRMLGEGKSACVFQFESQGMQTVLRRTRPTRIEDLIALNALYRPGPMENIDQFIDSKNGRVPISYPLPELEGVLKETYGVIVYQEQVMEIVRIVAGFSLGQADLLRKAMGKKKLDVMEQMKAEFAAGAASNGFPAATAAAIFDLLLPFAGYGFNKAHAAAYSVLAYKTAYLKANFPAEFMAANLTNEINDPKKFPIYIDETKAMGITIRPPDVNVSEKVFTVSNGEIVYGMIGIKNVGSAAVDEIIRERTQNGPFASFPDFLERIDSKVVNRKMIEAGIQCGLFDALHANRCELMENLNGLIAWASRRRDLRASGQSSLFDGTDDAIDDAPITPCAEWDSTVRLQYEKDNLGFYVSGHPLDRFRATWENCTTLNLSRPESASSERSYSVVGMLRGVRVIISRKGTPIGVCTVEDFNGSISAVMFSDVYEANREAFVEDAVVGVVGKVEPRNDEYQLVIQELRLPDELDEKEAAEVHIRLEDSIENEHDLCGLRAVLYDWTGGSSVFLHIGENGSETVVKATSQIAVSSKRQVLENIRRLPWVTDVWKA